MTYSSHVYNSHIKILSELKSIWGEFQNLSDVHPPIFFTFIDNIGDVYEYNSSKNHSNRTAI